MTVPRVQHLDRFVLEILNNHFRAIAESMGYVLERTAHTTYIKETNDFATGLLTPEGEHFAYPRSIGAASYVGLHFRTTLEAIEAVAPGDIIIATDPFLTGGMATHLPDLHLLRPVFVGDELLCFAWCFVHSSDVGGIAPGSIRPTTTEIFQEGLRVPPLKLYERGVLQDDLLDVLLINCRIPDKNWGDMKAEIAALNTAEARTRALVDKFGIEAIREGMYGLIDYGEQRARAALAQIPDGEYRLTDYLEDDVVSDVPVRINICLTVSGDEAHLDFTGSDPQVGAAFNIATGGHKHPFMAGALFWHFYSTDPSFPVNAGLIRPLRMTLPLGSVVNAQYPAACGVRHSTVHRIYDTLQGILCRALPGRIPAAGAGQAAILAVSLMDPSTGQRHVTVVEPMIGGSGARSDRDGIVGIDFRLGFLKNTPVESLETEVPIVIRRYEAIPDSGGPGTYCGGAGLRLDFQVFHPDTIVTARGMERLRFSPWGAHGGAPGSNARALLLRNGLDAQELGKIDVVRLQPGDVLRLDCPGGGGYGDSWERDPERVAADVRDGLVSVEAARERHGVVLVDGGVDAAATTELRRTRGGTQGLSPVPVCFSPRVTAYETRWPPLVQDQLVARLMQLPVGLRYYAKLQLWSRLGAIEPEGPITPALVDRTWHDLLPTLGLSGSDAPAQ